VARKLKSYETSLGFFDLAIAAPSMKAALEAWGADSNLFHQGAARESDDRDVIAATMAAPGVVLKRPVGSNGPFKTHADLPTSIGGGDGPKQASRKPASRARQKHQSHSDGHATDRKAALAFQKEQERRKRERAKEEAARQREQERRQQVIDKAQREFDEARRKHEEKAVLLKARLEAVEEEVRAEEARWEAQRRRLEAALRRVRER
jgi:hypothetical protein